MLSLNVNLPEKDLETSILQQLHSFYNGLSIIDKLNNNDTILLQLISEYKKYISIEKIISTCIIQFITEHHLYYYATPGVLERILQDIYYFKHPELYIHCIQEITDMSKQHYQSMITILCDHCTTYYNHPIRTDIYQLQQIISLLPTECIYHILFESVCRNAKHIIFFIYHYIGDKKLKHIESIAETQYNQSFFKHRYTDVISKLMPYTIEYNSIQSILNEQMYKDEVSIVNLFLYGIRGVN